MASRWRCPPESVAPAFAHAGVVLVGELHDRVVQVGDLAGDHHRLLAHIRAHEQQVLADGPVEQERLLEDDPDMLPQRGLRERADVRAADGDRPRPRVVKPQQQRDERALAAAGVADESNFLARSHQEVDVAQDRGLAVVAERDVPELDAAVNPLARQHGGPRVVLHVRVLAQEIDDPLQRDHAPLEGVVEAHQGARRCRGRAAGPGTSPARPPSPRRRLR